MKQRVNFFIVLLLVAQFASNPVFASDIYSGKNEFNSFFPLISKPKKVWQQTSKGMETGNHLFGISPNFSEDKTIFSVSLMNTAMGDGGSIHRSLNGGRDWELLNEGLDGSAITSLQISPNYRVDCTLIIETMNQDTPVYKSEDCGETWNVWEVNLNNIKYSPNYRNDYTMFGTRNGLYKSMDKGQTWELINDNEEILQYEISPTYAIDSTLIFKVRLSTGLLYKTTDGGTNWVQLSLLPKSVELIIFSPDFAYDQTIYVSLFGSWANRSIMYKSFDGGENWYPVTTDPNSPGLWGTTVQISPNHTNDHSLFVLGFKDNETKVYKSSDGGESWQNTGLNVECKSGYIRLSESYVFDQTLWAGCKEGFFQSNDGGDTWNKLSNGTISSVISDIDFSPNYANDGTVFASTTCDGVYKSTNRGKTWEIASFDLYNSCILSLDISPNFVSDQTIIAGGSYEGVYKSQDGGATWTCIFACEFSRESLVREVKISPNYTNDHTMFAGTLGGLFLSTNEGVSWSEVEPEGFILDNIHAIALSPLYTQDLTLFVGTDFIGDGFAKSVDAGNTWSLLFRTRAVSDIIWVTNYESNEFPIFYSHCPNIICYSNDVGETWNCYSHPDRLNISKLAYSTDKGVLFAGTAGTGVSKSIDYGMYGMSWESFNENLGSLSIYYLIVSPTNPSILFAGTTAGLWQIELP